MNLPNLKDFLRIGEAAVMVGVSPATLRRWDRSGKLKAIKHPINRFRLYRQEDLQAFLRLLDPTVNRSTRRERGAPGLDFARRAGRTGGSLKVLSKPKKAARG